MPDAVSTAPVRLARLDGLRGLAAAGVAFTYHARDLFVPGALDSGIGALDWFHAYGWLFVDLFFLLSGYIFAHVYLGRGRPFTAEDLTEFGVARFARLYPLHLLLLVITAALFWGKPENTPLAFAGHLLMLQAFVPPVAQTFVGPSWSLSIEAVCYVLFAYAAAAGPRQLRQVTGAAIAMGLFLLLLKASPEGPFARDNLPRGLLGFFLGQALWHGREWLARVPSAVLWGVMALGIALPPEWLGAVVPYAVLVFPAALVLGLRLRWLESRPLVWLGDRSYALYLIHLPLLQFAVKLWGPVSGSTWGLVLGLGLFIGATSLLADLALRWIEYPARSAIRAAWLRRRKIVPALA
ncbi:MAG TPA: acyltransferase [Novosphingobium sp.]|nr:acyltransferase [Novosphingobium sp.]